MSICIARLRETMTPLMRSCAMSGKERRFQVPRLKLDSTAGSRNESGSEFQTVGPAIEKARMCQKCCDETAEYSVCGGWPNGDQWWALL